MFRELWLLKKLYTANWYRSFKGCTYSDISVKICISTQSVAEVMDGIMESKNKWTSKKRNSREAWIESDRCKGKLKNVHSLR